MRASHSDCSLSPLEQKHINWLLAEGVTTDAMIHPDAILLAYGDRADDGRFDAADDGRPWLAIQEADRDFVFWSPKEDKLSTFLGRAFALGEDAIDDPSTYALGYNLNVYASPLEWLRAKRDGCVILDWTRVFDRLRDCPRISLAERLLVQYRRFMKPAHMPQLFVIPNRRAVA